MNFSYNIALVRAANALIRAAIEAEQDDMVPHIISLSDKVRLSTDMEVTWTGTKYVLAETMRDPQTYVERARFIRDEQRHRHEVDRERNRSE